MEAVLPVKVSGDFWAQQDLERLKMLVNSLKHFWRGELRLHVIAPKNDLDTLRKCITSSKNIEVLFVSEDNLLPFLSENFNCRGWLKQQLIKIAASKLVSSDFFLTLDADLILVKPASRDKFIVLGKALTDWEPRSYHPHWWSASQRALQMPVIVHEFGLSVTPEILSCTLCRNLIDHLNLLYGGDGLQVLAKLGEAGFSDTDYLGWTEYTIYNCFADLCGEMEKMHHSSDWMSKEQKAIRISNNLWFREHLSNFDLKSIFERNRPGYFAVIQSNTKILASDIKNTLGEDFPFLFSCSSE